VILASEQSGSRDAGAKNTHAPLTILRNLGNTRSGVPGKSPVQPETGPAPMRCTADRQFGLRVHLSSRAACVECRPGESRSGTGGLTVSAASGGVERGIDRLTRRTVYRIKMIILQVVRLLWQVWGL
jgi:hypothetical protein